MDRMETEFLEKEHLEQLARAKYRNREDLLRTNDCISKETGVLLVVPTIHTWMF